MIALIVIVMARMIALIVIVMAVLGVVSISRGCRWDYRWFKKQRNPGKCWKICDEIRIWKDADIQKKLKTKKKREMFLEKIMSIEEDIKLYQKDKKEFLSELNKDGQNKDNQNSMKDFMDDNLNILKSIESN